VRAKDEFCGRFMTPSLRNVAVRKAFFHNGVFHQLEEVVEFYATRDSDPAKWYKAGKFDDLPAEYHGNVEAGPPFRAKAVLTDQDVRDIVAFLQTLTDGFDQR